MSLVAGNRLGPYEVLGVIGAGGMGEVYKVRDRRLDRIVAVKVLPAAFIADPDRRARFEHEAQAIAALSHPNILAIHDTGVHDGQMFVVTELLEGETLRDRLHAGGVPVRKAIEWAVQIARALAAAHEKAIVHRDLKPENIFLLADGQVKLIDFGLAKAHVDRGVLETMTATEPGTVMGTVGYMAPEQVRGLTVDARADLFALGAVLYEMLSGRPAFKRDTAADTMTAVLNADPPPLTGTQTDFSPALQRVVDHALEKNLHERFQSARDFGFALDALSGSATSAATAVSRATRRPRIRSYAAIILIVAALTGSYVVGRRSVTPLGLDAVRFEPKTFEPQFITNARFLPDGQSIVFSAALEGTVPELFVSRANTLAPQPLGHPRTHLLSVSSKGELAVLTDAKFIGQRLSRGTLARMPIDGAPRAWMTNVREADWSPDGSSLAAVHNVDPMDRLEYPIGHVLYESAGYLSDPRVSPDGIRVAFCEHPNRGFDDRGWVKIVDRSGTVRTLAGEYSGIQGVAWMRDAQRVLFSAVTSGIEGLQTHVVPASASASHVCFNVRRGRAAAYRTETRVSALQPRLLEY
jgi:eukaryotic-like serine/threonine-protein kinase